MDCATGQAAQSLPIPPPTRWGHSNFRTQAGEADIWCPELDSPSWYYRPDLVNSEQSLYYDEGIFTEITAALDTIQGLAENDSTRDLLVFGHMFIYISHCFTQTL